MKEKYDLRPVESHVKILINIILGSEQDKFMLPYDDGSNESVSTSYFASYALHRSGNIGDIVSSLGRVFRNSYNEKMSDMQKLYGKDIDKIMMSFSRKNERPVIEVVNAILNKLKYKTESDVVYVAWMMGAYFAEIENKKMLN